MPDPVTYTAVITIGRPPGRAAGRRVASPRNPPRPTRPGNRSHPVLVLRWFPDAARIDHLARGHMLHSGTRVLAGRGNCLLKATFKALRRVSLCPRQIGAITAAALALMHTEYGGAK